MAQIIEQYLDLPPREQAIVRSASREPQTGATLLRLYFPAITAADFQALQSYLSRNDGPA